MKIIKYICDRCGKEIVHPFGHIDIFVRDENEDILADQPAYWAQMQYRDFCPDCCNDIINFALVPPVIEMQPGDEADEEPEAAPADADPDQEEEEKPDLGAVIDGMIEAAKAAGEVSKRDLVKECYASGLTSPTDISRQLGWVLPKGPKLVSYYIKDLRKKGEIE